jgi:hypothetical protein
MIYPILILLAIYNGLIIQWFNNKNKDKQNKYSNLWHATGWVIRLLLILMLPFKYIPLGIFLSWTCYNYIINLIIGKPIWYLGITGSDKYMNKTIQRIIDVVLFLLSIIFVIFL